MVVVEGASVTSVRAVSAEFDLLCPMVRPRPDLTRVRERIAAGIDFEILFEMAGAHGIRPMLLLAIAALSGQGVPGTIRASLRYFQRTHLARVLSQSEEVCRVARLFAAGGVPFAVFKGPVLAAYLYGELSHREFSDIDVIVPPEHMAKAETLLASLGYGNRQGDRAFRQAFLAHQRQYAFVRPEFDSAIDLHWHFSGLHLPFPVQPDEIWPSLVSVQVGSCTVPSLSDVDLALMLAGHGTKESWKSLGWVCDFAMLIERKPDLDWSEIHRRARRQHCGDAVLLGCAMASGLLEAPVPPVLSAAVSGNVRVQRLAASLIAGMREGLVYFPEMKPNFVDLDLCERRFDRFKFLLGLAVTPTPGDYRALPLPRALWGAYYLTRPLRQVLKYVGRRG
jgi:hypothetical protein